MKLCGTIEARIVLSQLAAIGESWRVVLLVVFSVFTYALVFISERLKRTFSVTLNVLERLFLANENWHERH